MFSDDIIKYFTSRERYYSLQYVERFTVFHKEKYIYKTKPTEVKPKNKIGYSGIHFLQSSLYKSRKLTEAHINFLNNYDPFLMSVVTRTHYEIVGSISFLYKKLVSYYDGNSTLEVMSNALARMLIGTKMKDHYIDAPDPFNVMTYIQSVDEMYPKLTSGEKAEFRVVYDFLSEICHTNAPGQYLTFDIEPNTKEVTYYDNYKIDHNKDELYHFHSYFVNSIIAFELFYNECMKLLEKNEELPIIER